ncbi:MAG TPA: hypothetical protein GX002_02075 [Clostridiales bacterium]|nr:hypothetical protein [Clostridiales bacterium]
MNKRINQAAKWERICKTVYQKVDLFSEAKKARKNCRRQLAKIKGGFRGSNYLFKEKVLSF